jgi:hypothetical protein
MFTMPITQVKFVFLQFKKLCHTSVILCYPKEFIMKEGTRLGMQWNEKLQNSGERFVKFPDNFMIAIGG